MANTTVVLAGLALLGAILPLSMSGSVSSYAAVFPPREDMRQALSRVSDAGPGWRVLRVLVSHPLPILIVVHDGTGGPRLAALLLPVPSAPGCRFPPPGR